LLLDAVVKVALDLTPLIIRGAHQSSTGALQLLQRLRPAGVQLRVLSRQEREGAGCFQELGVVVELRVVDDRDGRRAPVVHELDVTAGFGWQGPVAAADEDQPQIWIAERTSQHRLELVPGRSPHRLPD